MTEAHRFVPIEPPRDKPPKVCRGWLVSSVLGALLATGWPGGASPGQPPPIPPRIKATGNQPAAHRGLYEIEFSDEPRAGNPFTNVELTVTFTRPDGTSVKVDGFFDGGRRYAARAYCDTAGQWRWRSDSSAAALDGREGTFEVVASPYQGKLRKHPADGRQFAYDDGEWFLHIGDTGYRYVVAGEPQWREYLHQAARMGATKIRTWFCQGRHDVQALFEPGRKRLNLPYWQEIDRRVTYALERHPEVMLQLILYGEDTEELTRYGQGDAAARLLARYAQARFSALPNVTWCISNDRQIVPRAKPGGRQVSRDDIDRIGLDMASREPWGTLLTNHQSRLKGYDFTDAPWSDIVTLEDLDQVEGRLVLDYRRRCDDPIVLDEDRYELYRPPRHPRYYFRRLMWASLLSGAGATYGGLMTYEPFDGRQRGVQGYYDAVEAGTLAGGGDDFVHIHTFFRTSGVTLVGLEPHDAVVGDDPALCKCAHDRDTYLIYLANPSGSRPETDDAAAAAPSVTFTVPDTAVFTVNWFDPRQGKWTPRPPAMAGRQTLRAPGGGDWVLLVRADKFDVPTSLRRQR